jgi:hypothetical protein
VGAERVPSLVPAVAAEATPLQQQTLHGTLKQKVGGRLSSFIRQWQHITETRSVLDSIKGIHLEFTSLPLLMHPSQACDSSRGVCNHKATLIADEIETLLRKNAIERAPPTIGFYARLFLVDKKNGGLRSLFNLKPLNRFIMARSFKMATLRMVAHSLREKDFVVSLDLTDAYFHVNIDPSFRKFMRFKFRGKLFQFKAMPFGLC